MQKIKIHNNEMKFRLADEVEVTELIHEDNVEIFFEEDLENLMTWIDENVKNTYIEPNTVYMNKFHLDLLNGGQAVIIVG